MKKLQLIFIFVAMILTLGMNPKFQLGDERTDFYLPMLEGKRIALFSNQSGVDRSKKHILDKLVENRIDVRLIFSPEHGFRGNADAGESVSSSIDSKTGIPIVSLYGSQLDSRDFDQFDILVVDIQDVGTRFFTYYITMKNLMNSCGLNNKTVMILDRPNPNGSYVDGFILRDGFYSGVGALPIPTVHGMTLGELALMINGEHWIDNPPALIVIPCENYSHQDRFELLTNPSPNLKSMHAIYLYPSLCYFEGTIVSLGRGTDFPFEIYGHPWMNGYDFSFTPQSMTGAKNPPLQNQLCYGRDLRNISDDLILSGGINLEYVIDAYQRLGSPDNFFLDGGRFFDLLNGTSKVREMIIDGKSAWEIKNSWANDVEYFKSIRQKYLLYEE